MKDMEIPSRLATVAVRGIANAPPFSVFADIKSKRIVNRKYGFRN